MIDFKKALQEASEKFSDIFYDSLTQDYLKDLMDHIILVNIYANRIDKQYVYHDFSKITTLLPAYRYTKKLNRTEEEQKVLDMATLIHIKSASHHPEYWTKTPLEGFTRQNYTPNGIINATLMPKESLEQMVCDWCAVGKVKGNNASDWFDIVNGKRWYFDDEQQDYIRHLIKKIEK